MSPDVDAPRPIRGLPGSLPPGERLLWQGEPSLKAMALRVFHVRKVAIYFALLAAWRCGIGLDDGLGLGGAALASLPLIGLGAAAVAILGVIATLVCKTTVYSITSRRVVLHIGVALPITFNLPFGVISSASVKLNRDGSGTIPLTLGGDNRLAYPVLWPHARPWRINRAEPALRLVPEAAKVAAVLAQAVAAALPETTAAALPVASAAPAGKVASWPLAPAAA